MENLFKNTTSGFYGHAVFYSMFSISFLERREIKCKFETSNKLLEKTMNNYFVYFLYFLDDFDFL
jgi:hypothetical protein